MSATREAIGRIPAPDHAAERSARLQAEPVLAALLEGGVLCALDVTGSSMEPTLRHGDRILVAPFLGLPQPGQIVLARQASGLLVAHRLVEVAFASGRRRYLLQGDHEKGIDAAVLREDLIGRVAQVERAGSLFDVDDGPAARRRALRRLALARRRPRLVRLAALFLLATLCALSLSAAAVLTQPTEAFAPPADYQFAPGDVLSLRIWDGEKIDETQLTVQSDGTAFLPMTGFGSLDLGGRTAPEAKKEIETRLRRIYKEIYTELLVLRYAGHRVHLMGEVRTTARTDSGPGDWPLAGPTRLVSFLSEHGGGTPEADLMRVRVVRKGGATVEANLFKAVFLQSEEDNPVLADGDFVFVPSLAMGTRKVFVLGEVNTPGVVTIYDRMTLVEALARCGGISKRGDLKEVAVIKRTDTGQADMRVANIKALYKEGRLKEDIELSPGDIVYVPKGALGTLQDVFSIIAPALDTIETLYIIDDFHSH